MLFAVSQNRSFYVSPYLTAKPLGILTCCFSHTNSYYKLRLEQDRLVLRAGPVGALPTPPLDLDEKQKHNRSVIISGVKQQGEDPSLAAKFLEFLEDGDRALVENVTGRKNNILVAQCKDWQAGKTLVTKYNKKKFQNFTINLSLFSNINPGQV